MLLIAPLVIGGAVGSLFTADALAVWYGDLAKPAWNPPAWVFAPVWTLLYLAMGLALVLARRSAAGSARQAAESLFSVQLGLNLLWTIAFFGQRDIAGGLLLIGLLWLAIALTVVQFLRIRRAAAALLAPYLAWVSFASVLNLEIWRLNGGLG